jgi:hypothetical protein
MRLIRRLIFFSLMVLLLPAALTSCGETGKPEAEVARPKADEIRKEYRKGPLCVRLSADRDSLSIAESVVLTLEAEVEEGFEAELPGFGEKLGELGIRDYRDEPPRLTPDGKIVSRKTYTLDPFLSGDYTIASMQVRFRKKAAGSAGTGVGSTDSASWDHEITTEEITLKVHSLLEKDQKELALNPIRGPVGLPRGPVPLMYVLLGLGAAALVAGGVFLFFKRKGAAGRQVSAPVIPAHELAYRQLQEILDEKLIERGEIKLLFSKLSDVLRGYIENRFGIHAPRRTTEEFLSDIGRNAPFSPEQKRLLMEFLRDCDLVKFAEHTPSLDEINKAMDSCKAFIESTREDAERERPRDIETRGEEDAKSRVS